MKKILIFIGLCLVLKGFGQMSSDEIPITVDTLPGDNELTNKLALKQDKLITYVTKTASDTLELSDAYKTIRLFIAAANTISIPANVFPIGSWINFLSPGSGQTTFVPLSGMTMRSADEAIKMRVQGSPTSIEFDSVGVCTLYGDITN